jgi:hypothetical protein
VSSLSLIGSCLPISQFPIFLLCTCVYIYFGCVLEHTRTFLTDMAKTYSLAYKSLEMLVCCLLFFVYLACLVCLVYLACVL